MAATKQKFNFKLLLRSIFLKTIFIGVLIGGLSSCDGYVTPNKVERTLSKEGKWKVNAFMFEGSSITDQFENTYLSFGESGSVSVLPLGQYTSGQWTPSLSKKPTIVYIQGFVESPFFLLNDDWTVTSCSKTQVQMESENGAYVNSITLRKVEDE
jgi:hypothetical protein